MIPQFGLLSHISSLRLSSGHSGPVLTLSNAAHASLFSPCLRVADASVWATSPLGVAARPVICRFIIYFFLPVMLPSEIPKLPTDPLVRGFPGVWELILRLPSRDGSLSLTVLSLSLSFFFWAYLLSKTMGCLYGCLMFSTSIQKLFCGICSAFK